MTKKLVLLFSFLCISLLTYAGDTIPSNGWKEGKYYFKFIDKFSNQNCTAQADAEVKMDGNAIKSQVGSQGNRYELIKFSSKKNLISKRLDRKFAEIIVTLNVKTKWRGDSKSQANKTDLDSVASQIIQTKFFKTKLKPQIEKFRGRGEELSREDTLDMVKKIMFKYDDNGEIMGLLKHVTKSKRCIVPINDTIVISYKIKKLSSLDDFFALDSSMVDIEVQNENPTLTHINGLWQTYKQAIDKKESIEFEPIGTGRRAYQEFINKLRTEIVPAIINEAGKTLPADCSAEIRHLLENRLKIAYYLRNPMVLGTAQKMGYLADGLQVFEDIEFNEDMLYDFPKAWEIIALLSRYTGIFPNYAGDLPPYVIQMIEARGIPFDPTKVAEQGYLIENSSVQQWCEDVKEILNKNSIKANDFLTQFMSMMAYYKSAREHCGLHKKQIENIKTGYTDEGWRAPLKSIQMYYMKHYQKRLLRIK